MFENIPDIASKRILVCGATGFIGRNVVEKIIPTGAEVIAVWNDRKPYETPENVTWVQADLRDDSQVKELLKDIDIVIQAAATTSGSGDIVNRPYIHVTDNAVMNSLLLRSAYDNEVEHFIFFSCSVMYPSSKEPVREDAVTGELEPKYFGAGWTKLYVEKMCEFYAGLGKTKHTVIRHSNIYGPYDKYDLKRSHVFGATITKVKKATDHVEVWGTGQEARDFLHVDDLMDFIGLAVEKQQDSFGLYNVGYGESLSVRGLVETVIEQSGKDLEIRFDTSKPTIPFELALDSSKAKAEFGWEPKVELKDGIARTLVWWDENISQ